MNAVVKPSISEQFVHTVVEVITPERAAEYLKTNKRNRAISRFQVRRYAADMKDGKWTLNHQGIAFFKDGTFADGQHRLEAIIEAGIPVAMQVTRGLDVSAGADIDQHRQRQTQDAIVIGGLADWIGKEDVAVVRALYDRKVLTVHQVVQVAESLKTGLQFVHAHMRQHKRGLSGAVLKTPIVKAFYFESDKARLGEFCDVLQAGVPSGPDDVAAMRLRDKLLSDFGVTSHNREKRAEVQLRTERAIWGFMRREHLGRLATPKEPIYKVEGLPLPDLS